MTLESTQAYRLLGLAPGASLDEVKMAYRDLAQVWHPDRFPDNDRLREKAQLNLQRINEAYSVIRDLPTRPDGGVLVAAPPAVTYVDAYPGRRAAARAPHVKHSLFTGGMARVRHSLKVLWPSATYARRRRRRMLPQAWIVMGVAALLMALALAAVWYEGVLDF